MAFKHACFIQENTTELQRALRKLGYKTSKGKKPDCHTALFVSCGYYVPVYPTKPIKNYPVIDCGNNEEMFLAIASIRDDSDKYQWFISLKDTYNLDIRPINAGDWEYNDRYKKLPRRLRGVWRKATAKEIIEHFNQCSTDNNI